VPDGYTFCVVAIENMIITPHLEPEIWARYKSLVPVAQLVRAQGVVMASPASGIIDLEGLVKVAREQPGKLNYATFGWGSAPHLFFEWLKSKNGIDLVNIPYKGTSEIMTELMTGRSDVAYMAVGFAKPYIDSGKARPLAVLGATRSLLLPNVPTLGELGLDFPYEGPWFGLMAPPGTDPAVIFKISATIKDVLSETEFRQSFLALQGYEPIANNPSEFASAIAADKKAGETLSKLIPPKPAN
jgi:tripartite-type tricarboxylate transporter receptor subunit TctC